MTAGVFARTGDGGEAYLSVGLNAIDMVELVVLGTGRAVLLMMTPTDAATLASTLQRAVCAAPPDDGDTP